MGGGGGVPTDTRRLGGSGVYDRGVRTPGVSPGSGSWSTGDQLMREGCTTEGHVHQASRRGQGAGPQGAN